MGSSWPERIRDRVLEESLPVTRAGRLLANLLKILYHTLQKAAEDHLTRRAAALSFFTLLNLFPIAGLILFGLSHSLLFKEHMASVESALVEQLVTPAAREIVMELFDSLSKNLYVLGRGLPGFITILVLLFFGTTLMVMVERSLNEIWRAPRGIGTVFSRVTLLWMGLTLVPLLVASSFALTAHYKHQLVRFAALIHYGLPFLVTFTGFFLLYRFLPKVRFRLRAVLLSAFLGALFWEAAKLGLSRYVDLIFTQSPVRKLYGSLALVPIGMIWIYYSWVIVVFGAELVYVLHNLEQLQEEARKRWLLGKGQAPLSRRAALTLLRDLFQGFEAGHGPVSSSDLASRYMVHSEQADLWFAALEECGVVARIDGGLVLPSKPPAAVTVREMWDLYSRVFEQNLDGQGTEGRSLRGCAGVEAQGGAADASFEQLLRTPGPAPSAPPAGSAG
jgi:membrane protein